MSSNGYKIKVNGEVENKEAQELFFKLGYIWNTGLGPKHLDSKFLYAKNGILTKGFDSDNFDDAENKEITLEELRNLVTGNENGLISGADALRALADGKEVEYEVVVDRVWNVVSLMSVNLILNDNFRFRLKPRTITLNGIEIPAPFEPKLGEKYWIIEASDKNSYSYVSSFENDEQDKSLTKLGVWRTEEEIKQVVAALRSVFTCN